MFWAPPLELEIAAKLLAPPAPPVSAIVPPALIVCGPVPALPVTICAEPDALPVTIMLPLMVALVLAPCSSADAVADTTLRFVPVTATAPLVETLLLAMFTSPVA